MRSRTLLPCSLLLACSLVVRPALASTDMVLQVTGSIQGPILGGSSVPGHTGWIDALSYSWGVDVPIGANGLPTGLAKPSPLSLMKAFDHASLKLLAATQTEEVLPTWTMDFQDHGTSVVYYRIAMSGAHLMSVQQSGSSETPIESASFSYSTITFTDVAQAISVTFNWSSSGVAAIAAQGMLARGILLPPTPNPTHGDTQFRFSLPSGSEAELTLFDAQGRVVRELHHGMTSTQSVVTAWDGTDDKGARVAPGIYMARLAIPGAVVTQHFAVIR